uniref:Uncharacterized protein n=1 Tax=Triticum urartu TaxID=4572 RepID=A0A8R7UR63_TRIUA
MSEDRLVPGPDVQVQPHPLHRPRVNITIKYAIKVNGACVVGRTPLMTSSYVEEHVPWYPRVDRFTLAERFICRSQCL